jgi:hypothetical protein
VHSSLANTVANLRGYFADMYLVKNRKQPKSEVHVKTGKTRNLALQGNNLQNIPILPTVTVFVNCIQLFINAGSGVGWSGATKYIIHSSDTLRK